MLPGYAPMMYYQGLLDENEFATFSDSAYQVVSLIAAGQFTQAFQIWDSMMGGDLCQCTTMYIHLFMHHNVNSIHKINNFAC